jgi:recombination protein RecT
MSEKVTITSKEFYQPVKEQWIKQSGLSEGEFDKEISFAIQHIHKNPYLAKCDPTSVLRAVTNLAQVGLTLNPISKYAYLIPRYNSNTSQMECVLDPDYRGLVKLLTDSGVVKSIDAHIVFDGDEFEFDYASEKKVTKHVPYFLTGKQKGNIKCAYSIATIPDGFHCEIMGYADITEIKERSESYKAFKAGKIKTTIWVTDEPEMCRKTVIKRHYKYLPKSAGMERFEQAVALDNQAHGFDEPVDFGIVSVIESMIYSSSVDEKKKEVLTKQMLGLETKSQAFKMIDELKDSQPIIGLDRPAGPQYEIAKAVKNAADRDDFYEKKK